MSKHVHTFGATVGQGNRSGGHRRAGESRRRKLAIERNEFDEGVPELYQSLLMVAGVNVHTSIRIMPTRVWALSLVQPPRNFYMLVYATNIVVFVPLPRTEELKCWKSHLFQKAGVAHHDWCSMEPDIHH